MKKTVKSFEVFVMRIEENENSSSEFDWDLNRVILALIACVNE